MAAYDPTYIGNVTSCRLIVFNSLHVLSEVFCKVEK